MRKFSFVLNLLFLVITCAAFYVFMEFYNGLAGPDANVGSVIVGALMIHIPFIAVVGGSVASWIFAPSAFKLQSGFVKLLLTVSLILTVLITAVTGFIYAGFVLQL